LSRKSLTMPAVISAISTPNSKNVHDPRPFRRRASTAQRDDTAARIAT